MYKISYRDDFSTIVNNIPIISGDEKQIGFITVLKFIPSCNAVLFATDAGNIGIIEEGSAKIIKKIVNFSIFDFDFISNQNSTSVILCGSSSEVLFLQLKDFSVEQKLSISSSGFNCVLVLHETILLSSWDCRVIKLIFDQNIWKSLQTNMLVNPNNVINFMAKTEMTVSLAVNGISEKRCHLYGTCSKDGLICVYYY